MSFGDKQQSYTDYTYLLGKPPMELHVPGVDRVHYYKPYPESQAKSNRNSWQAFIKMLPELSPKNGVPLKARFCLYTFEWDGKWNVGGCGQHSAIYGHRCIEEALRTNSELHIAEGEKDVETLLRLGYLAISLGSAATYKERLNKLINWPPPEKIALHVDNDEPGYKCASSIAKALLDKGCKVRLIEPPVDEKQDISDYLDVFDRLDDEQRRAKLEEALEIYSTEIKAAHTIAYKGDRYAKATNTTQEPQNALEVTTEATEQEPPKVDNILPIRLHQEPMEIHQEPKPEPKKELDLSNFFRHLTSESVLAAISVKEQELSPFIYRNRITLLSGETGIGKSLLALDYACQAVESGHRLAYLDYEMTIEDLKERLEALGYGLDILDKGLIYISLAKENAPKFDGSDTSLSQWKQIFSVYEFDAIVIDTFSKVSESAKLSEQSGDDVSKIYSAWQSLRHTYQVGFFVVDHLGKDTSKGTRGSQAKEDNADLVLIATRGRSFESFDLQITKARSKSLMGESDKYIIRRSVANGRLTHSIDLSNAAASRVKEDELANSMIQLGAGIALRNMAQSLRAKFEGIGVTPSSTAFKNAYKRYKEHFEQK